jgi:hypothetical protein
VRASLSVSHSGLPRGRASFGSTKRSRTPADHYAYMGFGRRWNSSVCVDVSETARMDGGVKEA